MGNSNVSRPKIIIIGGGFGGLYATQALKRAPVDVTLIDRHNYHLFQPLMYQVATGSLSPGEIAAPLRGILSKQKNTRVLLGDVVDIDPDARKVVLADGAVFDYDFLVVAAGSQTSYYGHDDWSHLAPSLKTVEEATAIRRKVLFAFEAAERVSDPEERSAWLTFAIVGAGATGVELAGALSEIARQTLKNDFRSIQSKDARIILIDGADRILPTMPADLGQKADQALVKLGVTIRTGVMVTEIDRGGLTLKTKEATQHLSSKTVIWAGGVQASQLAATLAARLKTEPDKSGRIKVTDRLNPPGYSNIFIIGDLALSYGVNGKPLPGLAQVAMQGGSYAAYAILKKTRGNDRIRSFKYFDKGDLAVIGRGRAVADIFGVHLWGFPAWLIWLFVHLMYLVEFQTRMVVFVQWAFQYFTFSRGARLITGVGSSELAEELSCDKSAERDSDAIKSQAATPAHL
ncbi:MAG TPA: NAD(P)/FAD-dependent oxidoreductase [Blastocatellia bacterium]